GRRLGRAADPARYRDAVLGCGGIIDRLAAAADQRDQPEGRQPTNQRARESDPLADFDDALGRLQALDQLVEIARRGTVTGDLMSGEQLERVKPVDHVLVVVRDDDLHRGLVPSACLLSLFSSAFYQAAIGIRARPRTSCFSAI